MWGRFVEGSEWVEGRDCAGGGTGGMELGRQGAGKIEGSGSLGINNSFGSI